MSIVEMNGNVCNELVINTESIEEQFSEDTPDVYKYDPNSTELALDEDLELTAEKQEALEALEGDEAGVAMCRAYYDLNELEGGFCRQTLGFEFAELFEMEPGYQGFMTSATKVSALNDDPIEVSMGFSDSDVTITWGAEVFASGRALAASAVTVAATAIVFEV